MTRHKGSIPSALVYGPAQRQEGEPRYYSERGPDDDPDPRQWIAEIPCRAVKTVLIRAASRKEAERKLIERKDEDIDGIDVHYGWVGKGRVICEDRKRGKRPAKRRQAV